MARFESQTVIACPVAAVFEFLTDPANLVAVSPPEYHMRLVEAPERLSRGARVVLEGRRWGLTQRIVSEVTAFEPDRLLTDEQGQGPFREWVHTHRLEPVPEGTRMLDVIDFEPPGGLLGLVATAKRIRHELERVFAYRSERFKALLEGKPGTEA